MKIKTKLLTTLIVYSSPFIVDGSLAQGSIDVDNDIRMGITGTEHLKITDTNFSLHQNAAIPLIYGDFPSGNVGIGTDNPGFLLDMQGNEKHVALSAYVDQENWRKAEFIIRRARGTQSVPVNVNSSDHMGSVSFSGYNNGSFVSGAKIIGVVDDTPLGGKMPTRIDFKLGSNSSSGLPTVMTIKSNGSVGIGTTTPGAMLDVNGPILVSDESHYGPVRLQSWGLYNPTGNIFIEPAPGATFYVVPTNWSHNLTTIFYGHVDFQGTTNASDRRLKKNIRDISNCTERLKMIKGVEFDWINSSEPSIGVVAQDVELAFPELVREVETRKRGTEEVEVHKSVNYTGLIGPIIESLKELHTVVEAQAAVIESLESRLQSLEN